MSLRIIRRLNIGQWQTISRQGGAEVSTPHDVQRTLDHCLQHITGAREAMAEDMQSAAMRLGAAAMMLASASHAVNRRAAELGQAPAGPGTGEGPGQLPG
jgi:hypothetical protein